MIIRFSFINGLLWCELQSEHVVLNEHEDAKWLSEGTVGFG